MTEHTFASSDLSGYHDPAKFFRTHDARRRTPSSRPPEAASLSQEATVARIYDDPRGRPAPDDSLARKGRFLTLMADGLTAEDAAKQARIGPWRALRIVTETDFLDVVQAIRAGAGPVTVMVDQPGDHPRADQLAA